MIRLLFSIFIILITNLALAGASNLNNELFKVNSYDMVYGKEDAPIEVLEYYALTCPHCAHFYLNSFQKLKKEYVETGKVRWIKRSYTADLPSVKATMLLGCVDKQRFESYLNILLGKQSSWAYNHDFLNILANIASLGGMSSENFKKCMNNKEAESMLLSRSEKAKQILKIHGTPSFFINREHMQIYSENAFREAFDKILKK